jgi:hypothetical protein
MFIDNWRPELKHFRGKTWSGAANSQGITWEWSAKQARLGDFGNSIARPVVVGER